MQQVVLPSLWPRKKNTRGPMGEGGEGGGDGAGDMTGDESWEEQQRKNNVQKNNSEGGGGHDDDIDKLRWRGRGEGAGRQDVFF